MKFACNTNILDEDGISHPFVKGQNAPEWTLSRAGDHVFVDDEALTEEVAPETDLEELTIKQLLQVAENEEIEITSTKKGEIIDQLLVGRAAKENAAFTGGGDAPKE